MTRDEIVTALRCCAEGECHGCTIYNDKQSCQERVLDAAADRIEAQAKEIDALRNELCMKCGNYMLAHEGACNGCKWREM